MKTRLLALLLILTVALSVPASTFSMVGFAKKLPITVSGYTGDSTLTNFPVLVKLSTAIDGFKYTDFAAGGADLRFADANGNELPFEIDTWNTSGTSLVWVAVSELNTNTVMTAYYSNANPPAAPSATGVWSTFAGVWHFSSINGSGVTPDSTANGLDMTAFVPGVSTGRVDGVLGNCVLCSPVTNSKLYGFKTGSYEALVISNTVTVSGWIRHLTATMNGYERTFSSKTNNTTADGFEMENKNGSKTTWTARGSSSSGITVTTPDISACNWLHLELVYDGTTLTVYTNGSKSASGAVAKVVNNSYGFAIGNNAATNERSFYGSFDEVRLAASSASADRVKAEYDTVASASFAVCGSVIGLSGSLTVLGDPANFGVPSPAYGVTNGLSAGDSFLCAAPAVWTNEAFDVSAACTGYVHYATDLATGVRSVTASGTSNSFVYVHTDSDELVWLFHEQVRIRATAGTGGTVSAADQWADLGSTVTLTATPDEYSTFDCWTGDVPIGQAKNATITLTADAAKTVTAVFRGVRYVATDGDDAHDGLSWTTAFATVSNAVAALGAGGGTVYMSNGTYQLSAPISITNAAAIVGASGNPADVIVIGHASYPWLRAFTLNNASALVCNLTVTNSGVSANKGGGALIDVSGGAISNCVFTHCIADNWYGTGGGVYINSNVGLVSHCIFDSCTANTERMKKGQAATVDAGRIEDCLFTKCGRGVNTYEEVYTADTGVLYVKNGSIVNCTVVDAASRDLAGILLDSAGFATNCVVACVTNLISSVSFVTNSVDPLSVTTNTAVANEPWAGTAANFVNCATDGGAAINGTCVIGTAAAMFKDYAGGDYTPNEGADGVLYDGGANVGWTESDIDLAGNPRVKDKAIDIGCYECQRPRVGGFVIRICESNVTVPYLWITNNLAAADRASDATISNALVSAGANGLDRWQSYALGLDPNDAASVLLCDAKQDASVSVATFFARNVVPATNGAFTVSYVLEGLNGAIWSDLLRGSSNALSLSLPATCSCFRLRTEIVIQ